MTDDDDDRINLFDARLEMLGEDFEAFDEALEQAKALKMPRISSELWKAAKARIVYNDNGLPTPASWRASIDIVKLDHAHATRLVRIGQGVIDITNYKVDFKKAKLAYANICIDRGTKISTKRFNACPDEKLMPFIQERALGFVQKDYPEATLETFDEYAIVSLDEMGEMLEGLTEEAEQIGDWIEAAEALYRAISIADRSFRKIEERSKGEQATPEPIENAHRCSSRPKCNKAPYVQDAQGRFWCKKHAHRRGLLKREKFEDNQTAA